MAKKLSKELYNIAVTRLDAEILSSSLFLPRKRDSHKGDYGHVLVVGGDYGMAGAARMTAEAAARVGAGLVTVATRAEHVAAILAGRPELMVFAVKNTKELAPLLAKASVVVIGPGMGCSTWAKSLVNAAFKARLPLVVDAGALPFMTGQKKRHDWVFTPHPGEAAGLMSDILEHTHPSLKKRKAIMVEEVQQNRFAVAKALQQRWGGVAVLKGCGTIIQTAEKTWQCDLGNPGMATAGMGDVLSGIIAGLFAQGSQLFRQPESAETDKDYAFLLECAAKIGVVLHARAGDLAAQAKGQRGLLATDLFPYLQQLMNMSNKNA